MSSALAAIACSVQLLQSIECFLQRFARPRPRLFQQVTQVLTFVSGSQAAGVLEDKGTKRVLWIFRVLDRGQEGDVVLDLCGQVVERDPLCPRIFGPLDDDKNGGPALRVIP